MRKFILVGAKPSSFKERGNNPGGQLTASKGLLEYAVAHGDQLYIIDTLQTSFPVPPVKERLKKGVKRLIELRYQLANERIEGVIVFSCAGFSFYERVLMCGLARLYGVKSLFFMRDGFFKQFVKNSASTHFLVKVLLKLPHIIGAQGESWTQFFKALGVKKKNIVVVRNWLGENFPVKVSPVSVSQDQALKFIFVGWLVPEKGVLELIEAARNLLKTHSFELLVVGDGPLKDQLQKDIDQSMLSDKVKLLGWQSPDSVQMLLDESHVFVLPSKAEGFPNAMLEAMASGLPAICTDVGAVSDTLKSGINGALLQECSSKEIECAMTQYLNDPSIVKKQSLNAISIVKNQHSLEANCSELFRQFR